MRASRISLALSLGLMALGCTKMDLEDPDTIQGVVWQDHSSGADPLSSSEDNSSSSTESSSSAQSSLQENLIWSLSNTLPHQVRNISGPGGFWYSFTDAPDGGQSFVSLRTENFAASIADSGMISVRFLTGSGFEFPFAGIGFHWEGDTTAHDISSKAGICISYSSSESAEIADSLIMQLDWDESTYEWDYFKTTLPNTSGGRQTIFKEWNQFTQEGWGAQHQLTTATTQSIGLQFVYRAPAGNTANLKIYSLGWGPCP